MSGPQGQTVHRKLEHLRIALDTIVETPHEGYWDLEIAYTALPELNLEDVDTSTSFLGRRLSAPLMITAMTGGHPIAAEVNKSLAEVAEELSIALGVGSQRAALEEPSLRETFSIVRRYAPSVPIVANLGASQLRDYTLSGLQKALEMIDADALAVHLNPLHEALQPEGTPRFRGVLEKIAEVAEKLGKPLIVKEVGHGLSFEVVFELRARGIRFFDVAGLGGTNWGLVEAKRLRLRGMGLEASSAEIIGSLGVPTLRAIIEARWAAPDACIIASGGVRSGLDAAKALAVGADIVGVALPALHALAEGGTKALKRLLTKVIHELKVVMFLTSSATVEGLRRVPVVLGYELLHTLEARGIDPRLYAMVRGLRGECRG